MHFLLALGLFAQVGTALPADSVDRLRERARSAEARFERLSRQLAPLSWSGPTGYDCDEIVGRFCLRFDSTTTRPRTLGDEAARIIDARREAVEAFRRFFSAAPSDRAAAGPLVRLLIRDGRASEAVSAAGAFAALSRDSLWGPLLQGLAAHAAGADSAAEHHFAAALDAMDADERADWLDPGWLLDPGERGHVRGLAPAARAEYERRLWLLMDPFWLTSANERWNEHISRHVEARLLARVPIVAGMLSWGRDLDELTIRYGTPATRARTPARSPTELRGSMVEYWDTAQRAYVPRRLSRGYAERPPVGEYPELYAAAARSGYAWGAASRVLELEHQLTRFVQGDSLLLRVDGRLPLDSASGSVPAAGLIVYDTAFTRRAGVTGVATVTADTARFTLFVTVAPGRLIYSAELMGDTVAPAGRARYSIDGTVREGIVLSDLLVGRGFETGRMPEAWDDERLRPSTSLVFGTGDTLGVYAEAYRVVGGRPIDIEIGIEDAGQPGLLGRFARWVGRGLGLVEPVSEPRIAWRGEPANSRHTIALNIILPEDRRGLQTIVLRVASPETGAVSESRRTILIR